MVDRKGAEDEKQPISPTEPRITGAFSPVEQYKTVRRNALTDVRLGFPTTAPVTNKTQGQYQGPPHAAAPLEKREIADTRRNVAVQVDPFSPTLQKIGAHAGDLQRAAAPAQGVAISPPLAEAAPDVGGGGEDRLPSLQLVAGGIRVLGGHAEDGTDNMDSAVACVFFYMVVVVIALAAVLVYFFRSLYAGPPEMTPFEYDEEEELTGTRRTLEPPTTTVEHEHERAATVPLRFPRDGERTGAMPHGPGARSVDGGGNGLVTSGTADVKELDGLKDGDMASLPFVTSPDDEKRFVRDLASPPASSEGYLNSTHSDNWNWTRRVKSLERKIRFRQDNSRRIG